MTVKQYLLDRMEKGTIHMALIDPDKQSPEEAGAIARRLKDAGTDAIMIGGSTDVTQEKLDATALAIGSAVDLPTIYFPSAANALSKHIDAIYFMSMMNSSDIRFIVGEQIKASLYIKKLGIEPLSLGYIVVEPGMKVGEVGGANVVKRDDLMGATAYALTAEYLGMSFVYLEAGSGADVPVPPEMIRAVKNELSVPLIIGGGIRTPEDAAAAREAGADAVVTGTFIERVSDSGTLKAVVDAAKGV